MLEDWCRVKCLGLTSQSFSRLKTLKHWSNHFLFFPLDLLLFPLPTIAKPPPPLFTISSYYHSLELWTPQYKRDASTNGKSDCERRESCTATIMHDPVLSGIHWSCCGTIGIEHIIPLVVSFNRSRIRFRSRETSFQLDQKEMSTHVNKKIVQLLWFS